MSDSEEEEYQYDYSDSEDDTKMANAPLSTPTPTRDLTLSSHNAKLVHTRSFLNAAPKNQHAWVKFCLDLVERCESFLGEGTGGWKKWFDSDPSTSTSTTTTTTPPPSTTPSTPSNPSTPSTPSTPSFYLLADYSTSSLDTISLTVFDSRDVMRGSFEWTVPWPVHVGEESAGTESGDAGAAQAVVVRIRNKTVTVAKGKEGDYFKLPSPFSGNLLEIVPASREQEKGVSGGGSSDKCYYAGDVVCRITAVGVTIEVSEEGGRRYA